MSMTAFSIIIVLSLICACMAVFIAARGPVTRNKPDAAPAAPPGLEPQAVKQLSASIALFVDELRAASDAVVARLDQKERQLNMLVERAGQVEGELRRLVQQTGPAQPDGGEATPENAARNRICDIESRYTEVFRLHDQGLSLHEIAEKVRMEKGQLQLIFNLRRKV